MTAGTPLVKRGGNSSAQTAITVTTDAATAVGDLIIVVCQVRLTNSGPVVTPDGTGWTRVPGTNTGTNAGMVFPYGAGAGTVGNAQIFWKIADAAGAQTFGFTMASSAVHTWQSFVIPGGASTGPTVLGTHPDTTATALTTAAITTAEDAQRILRIVSGTVTGGSTSEIGVTWDAATTKLQDVQGAGSGTGTSWGSSAHEVGPTPAGSVAGRSVTLPSAPNSSGTIALGIPAAAASAPANTVTPSITTDGTPQTGETVTGVDGTWTGNPAPTLARQWRRDGVDISGATNPTYTLQVADEGHAVTFRVTGTNSQGSASATSSSITPAAPVAPTNTVAPSITTDGTPMVGETITGNDGTWTGGPSFTRKWKRNGTDIAGATGTTYTLVTADANQAITYQVTGTNTGGSATATSAAITPDPAPTIPVNTTPPTIVTDGTPQFTETVSVNDGSWSGGGTITFARQWKRNGTNITGATGQNYTLQVADIGQLVTCRVTPTNSAGTGSPATTDPITPAAAAPALHEVLFEGWYE